ncbi:fungal-specific transcription factor domain-containing protein [Mycena rebaudengoi]|nr:fungal-specific transcription factor domain-containing protein [Mycena rebaudengoi]
MCRKRKIRCDSASLPDGRCSNCIAFNAACTHSEPTRKRGPKNKHVEELKQQVESLEAQLRSHNSDTSRASTIQYPSPPSDSSPSPGSLPEEDLSHDQISERFRALSIDSMKNRFFGPSSGFMLVKSTMDAKEAYLGRPMTAHTRRPEFWDLRPWEQESYDDKPIYVYPESDLISSLMALYFTHVHPILPLLHRPTFERSVKEGLHLRNHLFGASLLGVLAVASRYSDDPRVLVEGSNSTLSCGWKYFRQVQVVQLYCLITLYSLGSSSPQSSWLYLGLGMRFIQERGEHRRKREGHKFTPETELWKRAFWVLLSLDRQICCFLGRPTAIHVEDYDVELPMEVDDEYWDHPDPEQAFKQPSGKPSLLTFFICHIRLSEILGSTLRRLYASNKSRVLMGLVGPDWEQRAVAELDSAMNDFLHSVPSHLRWDPNRTGVFFNQSALLYAFYYQLQITIHRPYIHKPNLLALTSLAICTSAARSGIHVADLWLQKFQILALPFMQTTIFFSGVVLLLNLLESNGLAWRLMSVKRLHTSKWQPGLLSFVRQGGKPPAVYTSCFRSCNPGMAPRLQDIHQRQACISQTCARPVGRNTPPTCVQHHRLGLKRRKALCSLNLQPRTLLASPISPLQMNYLRTQYTNVLNPPTLQQQIMAGIPYLHLTYSRPALIPYLN